MNRRDISQRLRYERGQALIEFILVLPMIFLLILNLVNFGGFFYAWITVADAARAGANYAAQGGAEVGFLSAPNTAQVTAVVQAAMYSLPNKASATITVCQPTTSPACATTDTDPESANFFTTEVDVSYTYTPFIAAFSFPKLGVYLTIPPTTIFQRAEMRSMQ